MEEKKKALVKKYRTAWEFHFDFYKNKFPGIDLELQWRVISDWINNNFSKASKRIDLDAFYQNWLGRNRPSYYKQKKRPDVMEETRPETLAKIRRVKEKRRREEK